MKRLNEILDTLVPFVRVVALAFGVVAAWLAVVDAFPFLAQVWRPKGSAQSHAIIAAALAIVAGRG